MPFVLAQPTMRPCPFRDPTARRRRRWPSVPALPACLRLLQAIGGNTLPDKSQGPLTGMLKDLGLMKEQVLTQLTGAGVAGRKHTAEVAMSWPADRSRLWTLDDA